MASIILASVGQAVGAATGIPFAGQIGGMIGSSLGSSGKGKTKSHYEGARLENLAVQTSTYGRMIPIVFGSTRIAGNVIWARPIREIETTTTVRSGGKGGGGGGGGKATSTSTTYSYYATLAIAVCEGEVTRVDRVWADSKLLDMSKGTYRIYTGSETQMPDALIESYQGVGATPAHRGLAYVVIEDFPLADYGNRIPNFTFEVTRRVSQKDALNTPVESLVESVMLIPGSGEFVYDTVTNYKVNGSTSQQNGFQTVINQHTPDGRANVMLALDQLQQTFPNLKWVGVAVNWFGTTMNIASCEIWPSAEYQASSTTTPTTWSVAGLSRSTARQIGSDAGRIRYGGTPDDAGLVRLVEELRARGLKIFFYPQILMDIAGKPWRGELTGAAADVADFFTKARGYNAFILHYANLVAGKVDAFAIGTEMRDLTKITSSTGVFPAVSQFMGLASSVKSVLGTGARVTYAADWSEYHHTDGGWYHLDPLWASASIDMVGIDAYFPLSDAVQTNYDVAAIQAGWTSGEGFDWYYSDGARTIQEPLGAAYAWKNIAWWWNNTHYNPGGTATAWIPGSKPVWFTEYGFASVDGSANQPNVFVDSTTSGSAYPRFSRGRIDFMAQRAAITATELQWQDSAMIENKFLWTWDARPYPYWPDLLNVWADGTNWATGHWVQGKLGASHVAGVVEEIMGRAGITDAQLDSSAVQMILDGFVLHERVTARAAIDQLMRAYFFTVKESRAALVLMPRDVAVDAVVEAAQCVPKRMEGQQVAYTIERKEDLVLPAKIEVQFLNRLQRYETHVQSARRESTEATETISSNFSLVLSATHARLIAETMLADRWAERSTVMFQLPIAYAALEPGDVVQLNDGAISHRIRIVQLQIGKPGLLKITGVMDAADVVERYISPIIGSNSSAVLPASLTRLEVLDIPAFPGDAQDAFTLRFAACGIGPGWTGATVTRVRATGDDPILITIPAPATIGTAITLLGAGDTNRFDLKNSVEVVLLGEGALSSISESVLLNGGNAALIGDEMVQFQTATMLALGHYRLSGLLRGQLGTEAAMASHSVDERFVLLDSSVLPLVLPTNVIGQPFTFRATSVGESLGTGTLQTQTLEGNSLKPLAPVDINAARSASGDVTIRWKRRTRIDGELRDYIDVPLREASEVYEVSIVDGAVVKRRWQVNIPAATYALADQLTDFGSMPATLTVRVQQFSALVGPGKAVQETLVLT